MSGAKGTRPRPRTVGGFSLDDLDVLDDEPDQPARTTEEGENAADEAEDRQVENHRQIGDHAPAPFGHVIDATASAVAAARTVAVSSASSVWHSTT